MFTKTFLLAALAVLGANAHVKMTSPAPLNDHPDLNAPMANASVFPCNAPAGTLDGLFSAASPAADWEAGGQGSIVFGSGGAFHNGGSCQISLSEDGGKTFKVIKSFIGDCPAPGQEYAFEIPAEAKAGKSLLAWSWFNHTGNREMYMNCAAVNIGGAGGAGLADRPDIFVANVPGVNDCTTEAGTNEDFSRSECSYAGGKAGTGEESAGGGAPAAPETPKTPETPETPEMPAPETPAPETPVQQPPKQPAGGNGAYVPDHNGWKRSVARRHARDLRA